ncbi:hypothetical protein QR680_011451 [Steinernema hermaphroditum]|uniref:Uncharacterized protein n=1 Tax=Steinernema hermaphroditum TaxID=289476 RepID=A0AA39I0A7_9BILA|nr:hypothetical protein QR680_011451 [Steinernema hermaphroditum]
MTTRVAFFVALLSLVVTSTLSAQDVDQIQVDESTGQSVNALIPDHTNGTINGNSTSSERDMTESTQPGTSSPSTASRQASALFIASDQSTTSEPSEDAHTVLFAVILGVSGVGLLVSTIFLILSSCRMICNPPKPDAVDDAGETTMMKNFV